MPTADDCSDSDDDCFGDVGFMFDNALTKTRRVFRFGDIAVTVRLVDEDPGAVQSGHYVWPAAPALSAYLVDRRRSLPRGAVLELGAGCGLAGFVASQLSSTTAVVFTDHDPGVLDMIRESIVEQGRDPELGGDVAAARSRCVALSWGPIGEAPRASLAHALASIATTSAPSASGGATKRGEAAPRAAENPTAAPEGERHASFDLVIASDVIYDVSVVDPLFHTVSGLLSPTSALENGPPTGARRGTGDQEVDIVNHVAQRNGLELPWPAGEQQRPARAAGGVGSPPLELLRPPGCAPHRGVCPAYGAAASSAASGTASPTRKAAGIPPDNTDADCYDAAPVFIMSQSFGYDPETERAVERACVEHGLGRGVVWDELAPARAHVGKDCEGEVGGFSVSGGQVGNGLQQHDRDVCRRGQGVGETRLESGEDEDSFGLLSRSRLAGTKLQLFWRK